MKIVLIRQRYNAFGGAERFVTGALRTLSRDGQAEIHLIARQWQAIEGVRFHRCNPFYLGRLSRDLGFAWRAGKIARSLAPALVQSHERLSGCDIYRAGDGVHREWLRQKTRFESPLKRWLTFANPYHLYVRRSERKLFASPVLKAVICNSHMVKNEIMRYFPIDPAKIHVIYNGVDTTAFRPALPDERTGWRRTHGLPDNVPVFLFVGSGFERKGLNAAIRCLARLPVPACLAVVGRDKRERHYRKQADRLGLSGRVLFFGARNDVKPFYALADAFILPTLYDAFANAALEAMASGLPVLTSTKSGVAEILTEGESGFIFEPHDDPKLIDGMLALCDLERAKTMGRKARSIAERFDWAGTGEALTCLYRSLL